MSAHQRRIQAELELSRRIALERDLQISRRINAQKSIREQDYLRLKELEKLKADQEYEDFRLKRFQQQKLAEEDMIRQRLVREAKYREYEAEVEAERKARQTRQGQLQFEQRVAEEERLKAAEMIAASRRIQLQKKESLKFEMERQNIAVLDEQKQQQKLEKQLCEIEIHLGTIIDNRNERKKRELEELQELDKKNFKLKQAMRSSKVKQQALEQSLAELSKVIV